jgi:hypothetical protein
MNMPTSTVETVLNKKAAFVKNKSRLFLRFLLYNDFRFVIFSPACSNCLLRKQSG